VQPFEPGTAEPLPNESSSRMVMDPDQY
jgi:hypothetical protein